MQAENPNVLELEVSDRLKRLGFDPGVVVYVINECGLTVEELKIGLFEHRWSDPKVVVIREVGMDQHIPIVVESITAVWKPHQTSIQSGVTPAGVHSAPDWYVVGRPLRAYFDAHDPLEVRAYFEDPDDDALSRAYVQQIYPPTGADPSTPLRYTSAY